MLQAPRVCLKAANNHPIVIHGHARDGLAITFDPLDATSAYDLPSHAKVFSPLCCVHKDKIQNLMMQHSRVDLEGNRLTFSHSCIYLISLTRR